MAVDARRRLDPAFTEALAGWLPRQRWFAGKGKAVSEVDTTVVATLPPDGLIAVAEVRFADGLAHRYHLPLGLRARHPGAEVIARSGALTLHDGTSDPAVMATLVRLITSGTSTGDAHFAVECPGALRGIDPAALTIRRVEAEQSNTSVVFGDRFILKLFRRLSIGTNPELEVHRGLCRDARLPELLGAIEADLPDGPVTLGALHRFVPDAVDGWHLAGRGGLGPAPLRDLGASVAAVHARLAETFGTAPLRGPELARLRAGMLTRLDEAARDVPGLAGLRGQARAVYESVDAVPGHELQRVHGDLHLGQVLHAGSRWLLIDFEGEPSAPIEERVARRSPLRDVAGMLRSLDYAAAHARRTGPGLPGGWARTARSAFLDGYRRAAGSSPDPALLRAHQLDKAVYEAVYETRNRPDWVDIPLRAIHELTTAR